MVKRRSARRGTGKALAEAAGCAERSFYLAGAVSKANPALADRVLLGELTMNAAAVEAGVLPADVTTIRVYRREAALLGRLAKSERVSIADVLGLLLAPIRDGDGG